MRYLAIDIETFSDKDLLRCGVYPYAESLEFEILLFAYAFDDEEVKVVDFKNGEKLPREVLEALTSEDVIKTAFNANFERICLEKHLGIYMNPEFWSCTSVLSLELGLLGSLDAVSKFLGIEEGKMEEGKELIKYFSIPPRKEMDLEKWEAFKKYCIRDVEVERNIRKRLEFFNITEMEKELWNLDQRINDRGILINENLVDKAIEGEMLCREKLLKRGRELTGLDNFNSVKSLKEWLEEKGLKTSSLSKENVSKLLKKVSDEDVREALGLRLELSKTSVKKYEAMKRSVCRDGRIRGLFRFYGANRTGRWAGRLVQVQNLPQNKAKDIDLCRNLLLEGEYEGINLFYGSFKGMLSELIRTTFIPEKGKRFIVADFSAIEARVIAYLSDEKWRLDTFKGDGKIYERSASQLFKVPLEEVDKELRNKGKIAELALGYGGSVGALSKIGMEKYEMDSNELKGLVDRWRAVNQKIVKFWWLINKVCIDVIERKDCQHVGRLMVHLEKGVLFITLPSGRRLSYVNARLGTNDWGYKEIIYDGISTEGRLEEMKTYGGKLVENIVQAFSRELLGIAMLRLEKRGYEVVMHVHDEVVIEKNIGEGSVEEVIEIMCEEVEWANGLPLKAEGFECNYYKKE
ncbi:MAG: DNA polymerase [Clostridium sp.]|uniref:DNA polymerase n=1 Tax=Clostridium sp. TaxID=1506 RepID=UPI003F326A37